MAKSSARTGSIPNEPPTAAAGEPAMTNDTDQYYPPDEYEGCIDGEHGREQPQVASLDVADNFLTKRCDVRVSRATTSRFLGGNLGALDFTTGELARLARVAFGSFTHPTFTPARGNASPPRVLLVSHAGASLGEQLNAYGADVVGPVPYGGDVDIQSLAPAKSSADAVRIAATAQFDVAWLEITNVQPLMFIADWLDQRGIPYLVSPRGLPYLPPAVLANGVILPEPLTVDDIPRAVAEHFPEHVLARLDLSRPLVESWFDVGY